MQNIKLLNKRETDKIRELIKEQWNSEIDFDDYAIYIDSKSKLFIVNKDTAAFADSNMQKLRINSIGMYFGELKENDLRLSIEGSQMIGKNASKNIIELNDKQSRDWMRGYDVQKEAECKGFVLVKHNDDFMGTGRYANGNLTNFVSKTRRLKSAD